MCSMYKHLFQIHWKEYPCSMRSLHRLYEGEASLAPKPTKNINKQKQNQIQWVNYKTIKPDLQATNTFLFGFNCLSGSPGKPSNVTLSPGTLPSGAFSSSNDDLSSGLAHITMACDVIPRILKSQTTSQNNRFTFQCRFDFVWHLIKSLVPLIY